MLKLYIFLLKWKLKGDKQKYNDTKKRNKED